MRRHVKPVIINKLRPSDFIAKYIVLNEIGKGSQAQVFKVKNKETNEYFAAKIHKNDDDNHRIQDEIRILKELDYSTIIKLVETFTSIDETIIILELCTFDLFKHVIDKTNKFPKIKESEILIYTRQIAKGLEYLHGKRICHRDIKLENILLCNGIVKITDFGYAVKIYQKLDGSDLLVDNVIGTPYYMAPEIIRMQGYSFSVDIWALGILLYVMLHNNKRPFEVEDKRSKQGNELRRELYDKILYVNFTIDQTLGITENTQKLIEDMLIKDPKLRPNIQQVLKSDAFHSGTIYYINREDFDFQASIYTAYTYTTLQNVLLESTKFNELDYYTFNIMGEKLDDGTIVYGVLDNVLNDDKKIIVFMLQEDTEDYISEQKLETKVFDIELF